jgi:methylthioribose-1-phosphate isomerase
MAMLKPIEWTGRAARIIDQTVLPRELRYEDIATPEAMFQAIRVLRVRGAPLIGVSAAYGVCLGVQDFDAARPVEELLAETNRIADYLASSRPTAVNLFWALDRMRGCARGATAGGAAALKAALLREAKEIHAEDERMCRAIGEHGLSVLNDCTTIHTHCNAGGLATSGFGTALAPVYVGLEKGKKFSVIADETRPLLQGARITVFELMHAGVPVTLICDNMAASVMAQGGVDAVMVGADRIAANGDAANKIGTYGLALIAKAHGVPFYVAAPSSTLDLSLDTGAKIPIEERSAAEVTSVFGAVVAPEGTTVRNPAFDVTPAHLITAIITEKGVFRPPFDFR